MTDLSFSLIIPAAGAGRRIGSEIPKPFLEIAGKTILEHTLIPFTRFDNLKQVILAVSADYRSIAEEISGRLFESVDRVVVSGGSERQDSISNGLDLVEDSIDLVAVHDSVRPFVTEAEIRSCMECAGQHGAAILAVPVRDTIKRIGPERTVTGSPERSGLWHAQTPQIFRRDLLQEAYAFARKSAFKGTDDASLVEYMGRNVHVVEGSHENVKITYPAELRVAEWLLTGRS